MLLFYFSPSFAAFAGCAFNLAPGAGPPMPALAAGASGRPQPRCLGRAERGAARRGAARLGPFRRAGDAAGKLV